MAEIKDESVNDQIAARVEETAVAGEYEIPDPAVVERNKQVVAGAIAPTLQPKAAEKVTRKKVQGKGKVAQSSVGDVVARMEEKINMLRYIDGVSTGDIPAAVKLSKEGREQLIQFQKDVEGLKQKYIISIQKQ